MSEPASSQQPGSGLPDSEHDPLILRLFYTLVFYFAYSLSRFVVAFLAIFQAIYVLFTGSPQPDLRRFGASLGRFSEQVVAYISWASDDKPFPFADWPNQRKEP
jgi:hypothetical protein